MKSHCLTVYIGLILSYSSKATAQITADTTLPNPSIVSSSNTSQIITGGTTATTNLFHSFSQFSIPNSGTAQFQHAPTIQNLFIRVTGDQVSNIDGKIETAIITNLGQRGTANLFLLNPNGILFGKNASLSIGGAFIASTADRAIFSDGSEFNSRNPTAPLLTIATPIGLQFGNNPGTIENQSINGQLGLRINNQVLGLLGGNVNINGGILSATNGQIEVAAIGPNGQINFNLATKIFDYPSREFRDITLSNRGFIQVNGATTGTVRLTARNASIQSQANDSRLTGVGVTANNGLISLQLANKLDLQGRSSRIVSNSVTSAKGTKIQIQAQDLQLSQGGNISTSAQDIGQGGDLTVNVKNSIVADGNLSGMYVNSQGTVTKPATGNSGNMQINASNISVTGGAQINSVSINSVGSSGNITLNVSDEVRLSGTTTPQGNRLNAVPSSISTESKGDGNAGILNITTQRISVLSGAQIITSTNGKGNSGETTIQAQEINLNGVAQALDGQFLLTERGRRLASAIGTDSQPNATGQGANLNITTDRLTLSNGGIIQTATFGSGNAGNINIRANQFIRLQGRAPNPNDPYPSSILAISGGIPNEPISGFPEATGKGGNITLTTPRLDITNGAQIALGSLNATTVAKGAGDLLQINADQLLLNQGKLNASTNSGNGGSIELNASQLLFLRNNSQIITQAGGATQGGNAGNISITSPLIVAKKTENSDINANAAKGNGGNIFITAKSIVGLEIRPRLTEFSDITASSDRGVQGTITLNSPKIDPDRGTLSLPIVPNAPSNQIDQTCNPNSSVSSQFTVAGKGGLPATPESDRSVSLPPRLVTLPTSFSRGATLPEESNPIREAKGVRRLANGKIQLLADEKRENVMLSLSQHCRSSETIE